MAKLSTRAKVVPPMAQSTVVITKAHRRESFLCQKRPCRFLKGFFIAICIPRPKR